MRIALTEIVGAAVAVLIVGPLAWWAMDRDPPLRVLGSPDVIGSQPVARGALLKVRYRAVYLRRCSGEGRRVFVDATHHVMSIDPYQFRDGIGRDGRPVALGLLRDQPAVSAAVPYGAAPGPARYQNVTQFYCNPLQKALRRGITFRYPIVDFIIDARSVDKIEAPAMLFAPVPQASDAAEILGDEAPPPPSLKEDAR